MVFSQLGIWKRPFVEQNLLKNSQHLNAYKNLVSYTILVHYDQVNYRPLIEHQFLKYLHFKTNKSNNFCKDNKVISSIKLRNIFSYKWQLRKQNRMCILTKPILTNSIHSRNYIQLQLQENENDPKDKSVHVMNFHKLWHKNKNQDNEYELTPSLNNDERTSLCNVQATQIASNDIKISYYKKPTCALSNLHLKKCESLQETKDYLQFSLNCEYRYAIRYRGCRTQLHGMLHQINHNNFSSNSERNDAQTNSKNNNDEVAKKLANKAEEKAKRAKVINDDHKQTIAQLEVLKAQVKKVHEEMQARKHESWTIKFGKLANSIGSFITKIGPTIGSILSMTRYANTSQLRQHLG